MIMASCLIKFLVLLYLYAMKFLHLYRDNNEHKQLMPSDIIKLYVCTPADIVNYC